MTSDHEPTIEEIRTIVEPHQNEVAGWIKEAEKRDKENGKLNSKEKRERKAEVNHAKKHFRGDRDA